MKITKTEVIAQPRQLLSNWSINNSGFDMEMSETLSNLLQEEIKWELEVDVLIQAGWSQAFTKNSTYPPNVCYEILTWCKENLKGKYKSHGNHWIFQNATDAMWFTLKWASSK